MRLAVNLEVSMPVTIYHNPNCTTSRNMLTIIKASGKKTRGDPLFANETLLIISYSCSLQTNLP
nr:putative arsenate reductase [Halomonas sp. HAL1]